ncbi:uncharacterized protein BDCG_17837 [Blastomyces dermatitidis ER-3]|uniref:Uncharacterized protein n=1 Tax=Ajellomyces dermatitidis (strain ER-3 / ATCC MYA-2586) TaxID=559297 RepID=A0ABX2W0L8_AJEDR|nr:uncharacterized protein BDCG_17837 [Blastomyces dermatitidis ER-3]OAT02932.1 hypothetical protein BDCG_17837 [Blastomyces dermatitidis ER-3]
MHTALGPQPQQARRRGRAQTPHTARTETVVEPMVVWAIATGQGHEFYLDSSAESCCDTYCDLPGELLITSSVLPWR